MKPSAYRHIYTPTILKSCAPTAVALFASQIFECVDAVAAWMKLNRLQLNPAKTEVLWCATNRRRHQLPTTTMLIDGVPVSPVQNVRDLGIYIDGDLSMRTHVQRTTSSCFAAPRQLCQIRRLVPTATFQTLITRVFVFPFSAWLTYNCW